MEVKIATLSETAQLSVLFHAYRQLSVSLDNDQPEAASKDWIEARIRHQDATFFIAEDAGEMIGFATLYQSFSSVSLQTYWTLNDLYVVEKARGLGAGSALLAAVDAYALATHSKGIALETACENVAAQRLYEALGYQENTKYKQYFKKSLDKQS
ncbi:GNAT family N-acetyltransferase [Photobacterium sp. CCB-ST2H9]|uniref:GNAT family N-acetyltransferase n=1 Tax=Photobacterium sp. CCB-ST2H9 TaxID=2912855 RepID=UPI0020037F5D|nr:GNAT family N-acetyltransferase [Photobacterium sp. CCB-ST2H9]UTM59704.1 GNAT family N-acetyltransferase [Photobacterium sp. CCB-ST2H9]